LALEARVIEPQALGVEEVTVREARRRGGGAESPVARDGMADRREMDADLVLPSRLGRCAKEREAPITLEHPEARAGRAAYAVRERLIERPPDADRAIDHRLLGIDVTVREREVRFLDRKSVV